MAKKNLTPLEDSEQATLIEWANIFAVKYPELKRLAAIPNGGSRNKAEAANLKKQGVKKGFPDLQLPVASGKYHGLFIEMKRIKGGKISPEQQDWLDFLNENGYFAVVCYGFQEAKNTIESYLNLGDFYIEKEGINGQN
jgi:hypothetical protein